MLFFFSAFSIETSLSSSRAQRFNSFFSVFIVIWLSCEFPPREKKRKQRLYLSLSQNFTCHVGGEEWEESKWKGKKRAKRRMSWRSTTCTHILADSKETLRYQSLWSMFASPRERGEFSSKSSWLLLELTKKWATTKANFTLVQTIPNSGSEWEYLHFRPTTTITGSGNSYEHRTYLSFL